MPIPSKKPKPAAPADLMPEDAVCAKCSYSLRGLPKGSRCPECQTPFSEKKKQEKRRRRATVGTGELMHEDAVCGKCSYSLRGLRAGGRCPECGTEFTGGRVRKYFDDTMTDAPVHYLRRLAAGCWLLAVGGVLTSVFLWAGTPSRVPLLAGAVLFSCLWYAGVVIVTLPRQSNARSRAELEAEWRRSRHVAIATQIGWVAASIAFAGAGVLYTIAINTAATWGAAQVQTPAEQALRIVGWITYAIGIFGLVPLCLILANLSDWAGNTSLGDRFRDSAWATCVGLPIFLIALGILKVASKSISGPLGFALNIALVFSGLAVTVGSLIFLASLIRLAGMSLWAISNAETGAERDQRLLERQRRHEEQLAARVYAAPPPPGPGPAPPPLRTGPHSRSEGHFMPRTDDTKPYDLAPDDAQ